MKNLTVSDLRGSNYKVRVQHKRAYYGSDEILTRGQFEQVKAGLISMPNGTYLGDIYSEAVSPNGGETVVQITTPDGTELEGIAKCSTKDPYNRRKGLQIALGRALSGTK